jgi:two-component system sensor histidine kinase CiaH
VFTSIRWRLVGWSMLVLGLILSVVGGAVYVTLSHDLMAKTDPPLSHAAEKYVWLLQERGLDERPPWPETYIGALFVFLIGGEGEILANPQRVGLDALPLGTALGQQPFFSTITVAGQPYRLYVRPLATAPREGATALVVGQSMAASERLLQRMLLILLAGGGLGLALSLAGAWFLAGRALIPIEQAFRRQQEFVADASHELRTPLTVLRASTDLLHQHRAEPLATNGQIFDDLRHDIARLERLAADLLTLARSDLDELTLAIGHVDLASLAVDVVRRATPLAETRGVQLTTRASGEGLIVEGDPDRLQQVLLILLDNALKHTPAGGSVTVDIRQHGPEGVIEVADTGQGIPAEHLDRIFDRFYRADRARSRIDGSTGLGLAIARSLVEAHGGQLTLHSGLGSGTTAAFRLRLVGQERSIALRLGDVAASMVRRPVPH